MKLNFIIFIMAALTIVSAQGENYREMLKFFPGSWTGHETGKAGIGMGERSYKYIMDSTYLFCQNTSRFEPQEKNPEGEVHYDWGFFSLDNNRKLIALREFHSEGFVIQYVIDTVSSNSGKLVFISESAENAPPGLKARLTLELNNENEFTEIFELAFPGKEFSEWLRNNWKRE